MRIALYQPDIPGNAAAAARLAACLDVPLEIIEPCGFVFDDKRLRRVGLDYLERAALRRHRSWHAFQTWRQSAGARLILLSAHAGPAYHTIAYRPDDILLAGRESAGVPDEVQAGAELSLRVPMAPGRRALNVVVALAMVLGEALRQTGRFPAGP